MCCGKCSKMMGLFLFIIGVLYLLVDLGFWTFAGLQWWTVAFLLGGVCLFGVGGCPACQEPCCSDAKPAAKPKKK